MNFCVVHTLPGISNHSGSDIAFLLRDKKSAIVAFEGARDFLSAPKPYVILRITFLSSAVVATDGGFLNDEQWGLLKEQKYAVYTLKGSFMGDEVNESHFVFFSPELVFECVASSVVHIHTMYHQVSSYQALEQYMIDNPR